MKELNSSRWLVDDILFFLVVFGGFCSLVRKTASRYQTCGSSNHYVHSQSPES